MPEYIKGKFEDIGTKVVIVDTDGTPVTVTGGGLVSAVSIADGAAVTLGAKADAKSTATDTTAVTAMQVLKQISASVQSPPSQAVTGTFYPVTQPASIASAQVASGAYASGALASGSVASGAMVDLGAIADVAVDGDAAGTVNAHLRGISKKLAGSVAVTGTFGGASTIADGADVALGAVADAAVDGDASGSVNAHLRGISKKLAASVAVTLATAPSTDVPTATPTLYNTTLTNVNTEYSQALPSGCRGFDMQCRTAKDVRFAFVTGKVAGPTAPYMTMKSGGAYSSPQLNQAAAPSTVYLASSTAGVVVELLAWV